MTHHERFAQETGMSLTDVKRLHRLMKKRHQTGTHELNGDPFPGVDPKNKEDCATAWGLEHDHVLKEIVELLIRHDMTFDSGSGLWGSIKKEGRYVEFFDTTE